MYSYRSIRQNCPLDTIVFPTWLVIDDAQESDAQDYVLKVYSRDIIFFRDVVKKEMQFNLTAGKNS